jgi:hypothetical protein
MDMARRMITFPSEKNVVSATNLAYAQMLPWMVTPASYKSHLTADFGDAAKNEKVPGLFCH